MRAAAAVVVAAAGVVVAVQAGAPAGPTWEWAALTAGALALVVGARALLPSPAHEDREPSGRGATPAEERHVLLRRRVRTATRSGVGARAELRPVLRPLADDLLAARRGVDLDLDADRARALLGDELYDLVRPDGAASTTDGAASPTDEATDALPPARLAAYLDILERL